MFAMYLKGSYELCNHELWTIYLLEDSSVRYMQWRDKNELKTVYVVPITLNTSSPALPIDRVGAC